MTLQQQNRGVVFRSNYGRATLDSAEMGEQDPKGLAEELRAARMAARRGERQLPGSAANTFAGEYLVIDCLSRKQPGQKYPGKGRKYTQSNTAQHIDCRGRQSALLQKPNRLQREG